MLLYQYLLFPQPLECLAVMKLLQLAHQAHRQGDAGVGASAQDDAHLCCLVIVAAG